MSTDKEIDRIWKNTATPAVDKLCDRLTEIHGELLRGEDDDGQFADLLSALSEQAFAAGFRAAMLPRPNRKA